MNPVYERNIELLKKVHLETANKISLLPLSHRVEILNAKTGKKTFRLILDKKKTTFHSTIDPEKEAHKIIESTALSPTTNVAFMGLGFAYHIRELLKREGSRGFIVVIEKDLEIFKLFLENFDLRDILADNKVHLLIDRPTTELFRFLQAFSFDILSNGVRIISHQPSIEAHRDYYMRCIKTVGEAYNWTRVNTITQIKKSEIFSDNTIDNFPYRIKSPGISALKKSFQSVPCIIVATGPSLRKNINLLHMAKGKAVIMALDSSLKILLEEGIIPDLIFSIDFTDNTINDFKGIDSLEKSFIVVDSEVCPLVVQKYPDKLFFIDLPEKPLSEWMAELDKDKGKIEKGLSVSHTAFLSAIYMKMSPIILIGQDLSFPADETHARGTSLGFPMKTSMLKSEKKHLTKNVFGGNVLTDKSLLVFLHHYRDIIDRHPHTRVLDATEGGARIDGTEICSLKKALLALEDKGKDFFQEIQACHHLERKSLSKEFRAIACKIKEKADKLTLLSKETKSYLDSVSKIESYLKNNDDHNLKKAFHFLEISPSFLNKFSTEIALLRDNITEALVMQAKRVFFNSRDMSKKNRKNILELLHRSHSFFENLFHASLKMQKRLARLAEKLEKDKTMH